MCEGDTFKQVWTQVVKRIAWIWGRGMEQERRRRESMWNLMRQGQR